VFTSLATGSVFTQREVSRHSVFFFLFPQNPLPLCPFLRAPRFIMFCTFVESHSFEQAAPGFFEMPGACFPSCNCIHSPGTLAAFVLFPHQGEGQGPNSGGPFLTLPGLRHTPPGLVMQLLLAGLVVVLCWVSRLAGYWCF